MVSKTITCPHCGKLNTWQIDNKFRPFCSERCKMIDLGAWASGDYRIETEDQLPETGNDEDE